MQEVVSCLCYKAKGVEVVVLDGTVMLHCVQCQTIIKSLLFKKILNQ